MSRVLNMPNLTASWFTALWRAMETLGTTEESRRRLGLRVNRIEDAVEQTPSTAIEDYRRLMQDPEAFEAARKARLLAEP